MAMNTMNTVDTQVENLLAQGKEAAKAGESATARLLLTQVVESDPHNEQAWMWLSGVVGSPEEQQICLENVLVINPFNTKAQQAVDFLRSKAAPAPVQPTELTSPLTGALPTSAETWAQAPANMYPDVPVFAPTENAVPDWLNAAPTTQVGQATGLPPVQDAPVPVQNDFSFATIDTPNPTGTANNVHAANMHAADIMASDPWNSDSSAMPDIDWSRGGGSAPFDEAGFSTDQPVQQWPGADMLGGTSSLMSGTLPDWSLDSMPGFEPLQPGTLNMGGLPQPDQQHSVMGGPAQLDGLNGFPGVGMGGDFQLPDPSTLPGYDGSAQQDAKPWYAQSSAAKATRTGAVSGFDHNNSDELTQHLASGKASPAVMIACPNCSEQVPDTALACPKCNFSFFVNCPHCHELVDTVDAKLGTTEPCPYCAAGIDKMKMGMTNADPAVTYESKKLSKMEAAVPAMQHYVAAASERRGFSWAWVVDVMWLAALVAMVWALTQVPVWMHMAGQYQ